MGTVLGYYFGAASGERAARQANQLAEGAIEGKERAKALSDQWLGVSQDQMDESRELINQLLQRIEALAEGGENAETEQAAGEGEGDTDSGTEPERRGEGANPEA